ncbi:TPA: hypothetical protein ACGEYS_000762 [Kluyvera cryocrescens]
MWFVVDVDENNRILYSKELDDSEDKIGSGNVIYSAEGRGYDFTLYWLDDGVAGLDWIGVQDPTAEIDVLDRRLAVGEKINYTDQGYTSIYCITQMLEETEISS